MSKESKVISRITPSTREKCVLFSFSSSFSEKTLLMRFLMVFSSFYMFFCFKIPISLHLFVPFIYFSFFFSVHFPKFSPSLHFLPSDLPQSLLRRICFVTPSNKGTQKRRKNEEGTKEERTKGVHKGDIGGVGWWKGFLKMKWREDGAEEGMTNDEK